MNEAELRAKAAGVLSKHIQAFDAAQVADGWGYDWGRIKPSEAINAMLAFASDRRLQPDPCGDNGHCLGQNAVEISDPEFQSAFVAVGWNVYFDQVGGDQRGLIVLSREGARKLAETILAAIGQPS